MNNKIKLKRTDETIALIKAMASRDRNKAYEAQLALAAYVGPLMSEFIEKAPTFSSMFTTLSFDADDSPSVPVDLYYDITAEDEVQVWSQTTAGGLATNLMVPVESEMKFHTNTLMSCWHFDNKHIRKNRMDVVGKTLTKILQEVMIKQDRYSATAVLTALGDNHDATTNSHVIDSASANGRFLPADLNALQTRSKRINTAWNGGTPASGRGGITDLVLSPERMEDIRDMAYNPVNTIDADGSAAGTGDSMIAAPDSIREELFSGAGMATFFGLALMEIVELGPNQTFTNIFETVTSGTFSAGDDIVVGINRAGETLLRAVSLDEDTNAAFTIEPDDQFENRVKKTGFMGSVEEGRMILSAKDVMGIRVQA